MHTVSITAWDMARCQRREQKLNTVQNLATRRSRFNVPAVFDKKKSHHHVTNWYQQHCKITQQFFSLTSHVLMALHCILQIKHLVNRNIQLSFGNPFEHVVCSAVEFLTCRSVFQQLGTANMQNSQQPLLCVALSTANGKQKRVAIRDSTGISPSHEGRFCNVTKRRIRRHSPGGISKADKNATRCK